MNYSETQRFRNLRWLWMIMIGLLLAEVVFILPELIHNPIRLVVTLVASLMPFLLILFVFSYEVRIDQAGVKYRFSPRLNRWKVIQFDDVQSYSIKEKSTLYERFHLGYSKSLFLKNEIVNITGNKYMVLVLKNGAVIKLGTEHADTMERILKRFLTKSFQE